VKLQGPKLSYLVLPSSSGFLLVDKLCPFDHKWASPKGHKIIKNIKESLSMTSEWLLDHMSPLLGKSGQNSALCMVSVITEKYLPLLVGLELLTLG